MHVVATAGHVDHGKSTLVRALTGMEPDRWAEERRRGMTIDLGYAWTTLPSGAELAFVDVPGHQRFIGNTLAGLGPVPAVLMVVAADEGWRRQSGEHLAAVDALGVRHGLLAVTRSDLADPGPALAEAQGHLGRSGLGPVEAVAVSGATGAGMPELRTALDRLVSRLPRPLTDGPVRLWVDRAFTIRGSGTVVTGTLGAGSLTVGDELELGGRHVRVRGLQRLGRAADRVDAVARVAVNLRAVATHDIARGDVLTTPGGWRPTRVADVRLTATAADLPEELVLHIGSAAVPVRVRPLGAATARLTASRALPLRLGDRAILRDPGQQVVAAGVLVLDADPPALQRRGAAARRADALRTATGRPDIVFEVTRRGAARRADLEALGILTSAAATDLPGLHDVEGWLVADATWSAWAAALVAAVDAHAAAHPLEPRMPLDAARRSAGLPDARLMPAVTRAADLDVGGGRVSRPGVRASLGAAESGLVDLEARLAAEPFAAPEHDDLVAVGLGAREIAAAVSVGRLLRLGDEVVLLPTGPARAMRVLAGLTQPFTVSQARQALGTTRRVAVPLLEHLDSLGWTVRLEGGLRRVVRS
jgi:selenocysteine-specific elongation factor